jgi:hypothetical protein
MVRVFNRVHRRDKRVVGVFVRFRAPLQSYFPYMNNPFLTALLFTTEKTTFKLNKEWVVLLSKLPTFKAPQMLSSK